MAAGTCLPRSKAAVRAAWEPLLCSGLLTDCLKGACVHLLREASVCLCLQPLLSVGGDQGSAWAPPLTNRLRALLRHLWGLGGLWAERQPRAQGHANGPGTAPAWGLQE